MATYNDSRGDRATKNLWSNCGAPNGETPPTKGKNMRPHVESWLVGSCQDCFTKFNVTDLVVSKLMRHLDKSRHFILRSQPYSQCLVC